MNTEHVASRDDDRRTLEKIEAMAHEVVQAILAHEDPSVVIPVRSPSNIRFSKRKGFLELGTRTKERHLFHIKHVRKFLQTMLVAEAAKDLLQSGKTLSLRGMYYRCLRTIEETRERTYDSQRESDAVLEDLEVALDCLREDLHVFAKKRGTLVGNITIVDQGDEIDCRRMGSGGYAVPSICEPSVLQFKDCDAEFVLHVEKDTVWSRFNEDRFWREHNCILTEGSGQPPRGVRRLLARLHQELGLPVYCLLDCDPWGYYIYSVIKQGSIHLAQESQRMAVPDARFLGLRARDFKRCGLSDDVKIALTDRDVERARQISDYPWFRGRKDWQEEIDTMLRSGFKMEVEALITRDISYVTEEYMPQRLAEGEFLD